MALTKVTYVDGETKITAENLNAIQDEVIANASAITNASSKATSAENTANMALSTANTASARSQSAETTANEAKNASHTHANKDVLDGITGFKTINGESVVGSGDLETDDIAPDYSIIREAVVIPNEGEVVTVSNGTGTLSTTHCYPVAFADGLDHTNIAGIKPIGDFTGSTYTAYLFEVVDGEAIYGHAAAEVKLVDKQVVAVGNAYVPPNNTIKKSQAVGFDDAEVTWLRGGTGPDTPVVKYVGNTSWSKLRSASIGDSLGTWSQLTSGTPRNCEITYIAEGYHIGVYNTQDVDLMLTNLKNELQQSMSNIKASVLSGKTIGACGDSFTAGWGLDDPTTETWLARVCERTGATQKNYALSARFLVNDPEKDTTYNDSCVYRRICDSTSTVYISDEELNACDYMVIYGGYNDKTNQVPAGDSTTVDDVKTIYGALNGILSTLQTRKPNLHIGVIIPYRGSSRADFEAYATAMIEVCKLYGVPYFNNITDGIDFSHSAIVNGLTTSNHPNLEGHEWISYRYQKFIEGL